jgi:DNA-binding NarL/FixJ family response regulator
MGIRILLADSDQIVRRGLLLLLAAEPDLEVCGEAASAREAVAMAVEEEPDLVLIALELIGGGVRAIQKIRAAQSRSKVLVLSRHDEASWVRTAVASGAHGYLVKNDTPENLKAAIRAVAGGRAWISCSVEGDLRMLTEADNDPKTLPPREVEVLLLMVLGHTYKAIADRLNLSIKTIEGYRTRICERLGLESRADLVRYCLESGLLDPRREL